MAESTSTYVSELVKHMKCLTEVDEDTLLDLALDNVAESAAEKLALKQGTTAQFQSKNAKKINQLRHLMIYNVQAIA